MINVDCESVLVSSTCFLEFLVVELITSEAGDSHVSWFVSQVLMTQFSWTLSNNSVMEWFRLIELFSILSSVLISVSVFLSSPAGTIPEGRVHHIASAIIEK